MAGLSKSGPLHRKTNTRLDAEATPELLLSDA